jgi:hypothetical protein
MAGQISGPQRDAGHLESNDQFAWFNSPGFQVEPVMGRLGKGLIGRVKRRCTLSLRRLAELDVDYRRLRATCFGTSTPRQTLFG